MLHFFHNFVLADVCTVLLLSITAYEATCVANILDDILLLFFAFDTFSEVGFLVIGYVLLAFCVNMCNMLKVEMCPTLCECDRYKNHS